MTDTEFSPDKFDLLLSSFCDSGLPAPQLARFNRLLRSSALLRRRYLHYMGVHATLNYLIRDDVLTCPGPDSDSRQLYQTSDANRCGACDRRASLGRLRFAGLAATAALILCGALGCLAWWWPAGRGRLNCGSQLRSSHESREGQECVSAGRVRQPN
jgi:hypothetical protein